MMTWNPGPYKHLYISRHEPMQTKFNHVSWEDIANLQVVQVRAHDIADDSYLVDIADHNESIWVLSDWLEEVPDSELLHQAWRDEQLTEAQRQMEYAAAFQRLMWREMFGRAVKKSVGDRVTIRSGACTVERAFPSAWNAELYEMCWGKQGRITAEMRTMGYDGELYRGYKIHVPAPPGLPWGHFSLWWLGDDLEDK